PTVSVAVLAGPVDLPSRVDDQVVSGATVQLQEATGAPRVLRGVPVVVGRVVTERDVLLRGPRRRRVVVGQHGRVLEATRSSGVPESSRHFGRHVAVVVFGIFGAVGGVAVDWRRERQERRQGDECDEQRRQQRGRVPASRQRHA
ncbi:unnamed protein product, partial [Ixodes hexagonus]